MLLPLLTPGSSSLSCGRVSEISNGWVTSSSQARAVGVNDMSSRERPANCPVCGSTSVARIDYGFVVVSSMAAELDSGRAVLGGCAISEGFAQMALQRLPEQVGGLCPRVQ